MQVPWFLATTPAPQPAVHERRARTTAWWAALSRRYIAWAERSHASLHGRYV